MRPTFKKLEVKDISDLERLVAENVEGIEAGLKVIDSRLLLGQAAIDLVGLDARGALVLIALDFTADESLLLRVRRLCKPDGAGAVTLTCDRHRDTEQLVRLLDVVTGAPGERERPGVTVFGFGVVPGEEWAVCEEVQRAGLWFDRPMPLPELVQAQRCRLHALDFPCCDEQLTEPDQRASLVEFFSPGLSEDREAL